MSHFYPTAALKGFVGKPQVLHFEGVGCRPSRNSPSGLFSGGLAAKLEESLFGRSHLAVHCSIVKPR